MIKTMMKSASLAALALVAAFAGADTVQVTVDGVPVTFDAAQPQMVNGRVLVPLRGVFEQLGASVDWNSNSQTVTADGHGRHVELQIGSFDASVNGHAVTLDVPPQVTDGTTMVPLRFLGQALGAKVDWQPQNELVAITSRERHEAAQQIVTPPVQPTPPVIITPPPKVIVIPPPVTPPPATPPRPERPPYTFNRDSVIPLTLDQPVSSNKSRAGDRITATVRGDVGRYMDFPEGTVLEGTVRDAVPASGSHAGSLDIRFTHIVFPDGNRYRIDGYMKPLNDKNIVHTADGRFAVKAGSDNNIGRDAAIGAGAGLVIGAMHGKIVGGAAVGGTIGAVIGVFDHSVGRNVNFDQGTRFGLILDRDLTIDRHDLTHDRSDHDRSDHDRSDHNRRTV